MQGWVGAAEVAVVKVRYLAILVFWLRDLNLHAPHMSPLTCVRCLALHIALNLI
jgi:hypothetical protein